MYNQELKSKFISQYTHFDSVAKICAYTFEFIGKYEEKWQADFCTIDVETITPVVEEVTGLQKQSKYHRVNILKAYVKWCMDNGVPGATDSMMKVTVTGIDKARRQLVANPTHLKQILDRVFTNEEWETSELQLRGFAWLLFSGVREENTVKILDSNVDFMRQNIYYEGRSYPIYRESLFTIERLVNLRQFAHYREQDKSARAYINRVEGQELLRGIYSMPKPISLRQMFHQNTILARSNGLDISISPQRIWLSGVYYRARELEVSGIAPNFSDFAADDMEGHTYSEKTPLKDVHRKITRDYMINYEMWKAAFNML